MMIALIILMLVSGICITLIIRLKCDIRNLNKNLRIIKNTDTNMLLTSTTLDKDICNLSITVNEILVEQRKLVVQSEKENRQFKQAITNVSHDLRTPLTSILGYIQMLKWENLTSEKRSEYIEIIEERVKYLSSLMNKLFEYSQIVEAKNMEIPDQVNVCNILRDVLSSQYEKFLEKKFDVYLEIPDEPVWWDCDGKAFERVISNLIHNALIHGVDCFQLLVQPKEGKIIFRNRVEDINKVEVTRLFDRFYTVDFSRNSNTTGLGLAIAKALVEKMNGKIEAYAIDDMLSLEISYKKDASKI